MSASPADTLELMANALCSRRSPHTDAEILLIAQRMRAVAAQVRRMQLALDDVVHDAQRAEMVRQLPPRLWVVQ